jgi:hypothetical protein
MSWPKGKSRRLHKIYLSHKRWRERNLERGLTVDGKPRKKGQYYLHKDICHLPKKERRQISFRRWIKRERYDKGLTYRGTLPWVRPLPELEQAWRNFRSEMERQFGSAARVAEVEHDV